MIIPIPRFILSILYKTSLDYDQFNDSDLLIAIDFHKRACSLFELKNTTESGKDLDFEFKTYREMQILILILSKVKLSVRKRELSNWIAGFRRQIEKYNSSHKASEREIKIKEASRTISNAAMNKLNKLMISSFKDFRSDFSPKFKIVWDKRKKHSVGSFDASPRSKFGGYGLVEVSMGRLFNSDYYFLEQSFNGIEKLGSHSVYGDFKTNIWQIWLLTDLCWQYFNVVRKYRSMKLNDSSFDREDSQESIRLYQLIRDKILNDQLVKFKIKVGNNR